MTMAFRFTKTPDVTFICSACGGRVTYHGVMLSVYEREGAWEHDDCLEILHGRPKGMLRPEEER